MSMFATETVSSFAPPAIERGLYLTVLVNAEMPIKSQLDSWCRNVLPLLPEKTILSLQFEKPYRPEADPFASLARAYRLFYMLVEKQRQERMPPIVLRATYAGADQLVFDAGIDLGALLLDGIGDGVCMPLIAEGEIMFSMQAHLDLLQAVRLRLSKTEFISCPSCGRTLFDLQSTTERIKQRTGHLKGVKIAVMGCIVNGPGEMADADFGYVGAGPGRIHLYLGKEIVKNNIPAEIADEELVALIKAHGMWSEPTPVQTD
ncbi:MAG: flavodoxin-dependent (E)-4-hydroxy-3-methylbut-2-enyl-diphosphate synthase [Leptospiraceae bacterium]|nr:flavodoxin-dependent (E)-4-hydroxy-3-methylbut-2-enyl-diphosphate synthase [Leptospiraceae bacterium]